jgi:pimeloyl-ACP methyl ester carboxylesterase
VRTQHDIDIPAGEVSLLGDMAIPDEASGVVIFAHGSGSSRKSPRNRQVAETLNDAGLATLLFDLLTPDEELDRSNVFDIRLLTNRLQAATVWVHEGTGDLLPVGYFGASTGAAAALWAAAKLGREISAVVSRGGRPDLAGPRLGQVTAATLLIVGENDREVLELNREAQRALNSPNELAVVPGATHLFEEPGSLEEVARLATEWFVKYLRGAA